MILGSHHHIHHPPDNILHRAAWTSDTEMDPGEGAADAGGGGGGAAAWRADV